MEELHSFQVDMSPSFSFSSSLKPFSILSLLLCTLLNLWSVSTIRLDSWEIQKLVENTPSFNPGICYNPCVPLKFITADDTPMLNVVRPTNIYFGHLLEIILFKDLLLFCVFPCKHVDSSLLMLRFWNTGFHEQCVNSNKECHMWIPRPNNSHSTNFYGFLTSSCTKTHISRTLEEIWGK